MWLILCVSLFLVGRLRRGLLGGVSHGGGLCQTLLRQTATEGGEEGTDGFCHVC